MQASPASDIKLTAVTKAIALLHAAGAQFKVIYNEHEFGELTVAAPVTKRTRTVVNSFKHLYIDKLNAMQPGDVAEWEHDQPEKFRSALSACAVNYWGKGNAISEVRGSTITLMRVE